MTALVGGNSPLNLTLAKSGGRSHGGDVEDGADSFLSVVGQLGDKDDPRKPREGVQEPNAKEAALEEGVEERRSAPPAASPAIRGQQEQDMAVSFETRLSVKDGEPSKTGTKGEEANPPAGRTKQDLGSILDQLKQTIVAIDDADVPEAEPAPETRDTAVPTEDTATRSIDIVIANLVSSGVSLATLVQVARASSADPAGGRFMKTDPDAAPATGKEMAEVETGEADDLFRFARPKDDAVLPERAARLATAADPQAGKAPPVLPPVERPSLPAAADTATPNTPVVEGRTAVDRSSDLPGSGRLQVELSILESRKYLGVATGQTAVAAVVHAVTENPEWNAMLRETAATSATLLNAAKNGSNSLKIQLSPAELGVVTATFRLNGGQLSVELKVETIEAYRQLSDDNGDIVKALKGHGYDIDHVSVQHVSNDRANVAPGQNQLSSASTGGNAQGGVADGRAGGQQQDRGHGSSAQGGRWDGSTGNQGTTDAGSRQDSLRSDGGRPGSVYL
jgi:hypothetical protein